MAISALVKKCQTEIFLGAGIKWESDDWRLFISDDIPLTSEMQLWECDLDATVSVSIEWFTQLLTFII